MTPKEKHVDILIQVTGCDAPYLLIDNCQVDVSEALTAMQTLQEECDAVENEQDRIIGEQLRKINYLEDSESRRKDWLHNAKKEAGYDTNISFDVVWKESLATIAQLREEVEMLNKIITEKRWDDIDDSDMGTPYTGIIV